MNIFGKKKKWRKDFNIGASASQNFLLKCEPANVVLYIKNKFINVPERFVLLGTGWGMYF